MKTVLKDPSLCGMKKMRVSRSRSYEWLNVLGLNTPFSVAESKAGKATVAWRLAGGGQPPVFHVVVPYLFCFITCHLFFLKINFFL